MAVTYKGVMTDADIVGLNELRKLADQEQLWWIQKRRVADLDELSSEPTWWYPAASDGMRGPPQRRDPIDKTNLDRSGYIFSVDVTPDRKSAILRATPRQYKQGAGARVSFYLKLDAEFLDEPKGDFQCAVFDAVHGNDRRGGPADQSDPRFIPDPYLKVKADCL